jgi:hypothetical protein
MSASALQSTSGSKTKTTKEKLTSNSEKPFEFKDLKYFKVDFCESSSLDLDKMTAVKEWLQANV